MIQTLKKLYQKFNRLRGRRIFIVPTRFGFLYALFLLLILLGAINYSNSLGHVLCFLLGSLGLVVLLHTYRNLAKIELKHAHSKPVFCGQAINFFLFFDNSSHIDSYHIEVTSKQQQTHSWNPLQLLAGYQYPQSISQLKPQQTTQFSYSIPSKHRGNQILGQVRIASLFPLGLYTTWSYFNTCYSVTIYPKPEGSLPLPRAAQQRGETDHKQQKGLDDFSGFNSYRIGDPIHAIAWKAVARDDIFRTKQFTSPEDGGQLLLSWQDVSQLPDIEARLSQLCQWVLHAESLGMDYGLTLVNNTISYGHGEAHCHRCLTALALYE